MTRREFPGLGFDPAPGDPVAIIAAADRATAAATTLASAAGNVASLPVTWTGTAADAFRTTIGPLPDDLDQATRAHRTTARALTEYAAGLRTYQRRASDLEHRADELRRLQTAAVGEVNRLAGSSAPDGSTDLADLRAHYTAARSRAELAGAELAQVLADAKLLAEDHQLSAETAARIIRAAADTAPYEKPGLLSRTLDRAKRWITDHADVLTSISTVLKAVSTVLGTVSLVPGLQFLAPFAIAAGAVALTIDAAIKLATGRGSWANLALDTALTVMPWGRVYRTLKQVPELDLALASYNRAIPPEAKGRIFRLAKNLPEGVTRVQASEARRLIRSNAGHYGDDVIVQGCRANYSSEQLCDIDIGIRVSPDDFRRIHQERFAGVVLGTKEGDAMINSLIKGIVHKNRAGLKTLSRELDQVFGTKVDISVIRRSGEFDVEPWIRL